MRSILRLAAAVRVAEENNKESDKAEKRAAAQMIMIMAEPRRECAKPTLLLSCFPMISILSTLYSESVSQPTAREPERTLGNSHLIVAVAILSGTTALVKVFWYNLISQMPYTVSDGFCPLICNFNCSVLYLSLI